MATAPPAGMSKRMADSPAEDERSGKRSRHDNGCPLLDTMPHEMLHHISSYLDPLSRHLLASTSVRALEAWGPLLPVSQVSVDRRANIKSDEELRSPWMSLAGQLPLTLPYGEDKESTCAVYDLMDMLLRKVLDGKPNEYDGLLFWRAYHLPTPFWEQILASAKVLSAAPRVVASSQVMTTASKLVLMDRAMRAATITNINHPFCRHTFTFLCPPGYWDTPEVVWAELLAPSVDRGSIQSFHKTMILEEIASGLLASCRWDLFLQLTAYIPRDDGCILGLTDMIIIAGRRHPESPLVVYQGVFEPEFVASLCVNTRYSREGKHEHILYSLMVGLLLDERHPTGPSYTMLKELLVSRPEAQMALAAIPFYRLGFLQTESLYQNNPHIHLGIILLVGQYHPDFRTLMSGIVSKAARHFSRLLSVSGVHKEDISKPPARLQLVLNALLLGGRQPDIDAMFNDAVAQGHFTPTTESLHRDVDVLEVLVCLNHYRPSFAAILARHGIRPTLLLNETLDKLDAQALGATAAEAALLTLR